MVTKGGDWLNWNTLSAYLGSSGRLSDNQDIRLQRLGFRLRKLEVEPIDASVTLQVTGNPSNLHYSYNYDLIQIQLQTKNVIYPVQLDVK